MLCFTAVMFFFKVVCCTNILFPPKYEGHVTPPISWVFPRTALCSVRPSPNPSAHPLPLLPTASLGTLPPTTFLLLLLITLHCPPPPTPPARPPPHNRLTCISEIFLVEFPIPFSESAVPFKTRKPTDFDFQLPISGLQLPAPDF